MTVTETDMISLLRKKYTKIRPGTDADRYVRASHPRKLLITGDSVWYTGQAGRVLDYLVIDTYNPVNIIGFEVKVSRSDWLRELKTPEKSEEWKQHCNLWYLVVSDMSIVKEGELPEGWGLISPGKDGNLRVRKQSAYNDHPVVMDKYTYSQLARSIAKTAYRESLNPLS